MKNPEKKHHAVSIITGLALVAVVVTASLLVWHFTRQKNPPSPGPGPGPGPGPQPGPQPGPFSPKKNLVPSSSPTDVTDRLFPPVCPDQGATGLSSITDFLTRVVQPTCQHSGTSLEFQNFVTNKLDGPKLVNFIVYAANNSDWSPSVNSMRKQMQDNGETYLTQAQVAYILSNFVCGNNVNQQASVWGVNTKVDISSNLYSDGKNCCSGQSQDCGQGRHYQLCAYFSALYVWFQQQQQGTLETTVVGYGYFSGDYVDPPEKCPDFSTVLDYNCVNTLTSQPNEVVRLINAGGRPGGSYADNVGGSLGAQEESAFGYFAELGAGLFLLPKPESGPGTDNNSDKSPKKMSWFCLGARGYNTPLPSGGPRLFNVGDVITQFNFNPLTQNYRLYPSLIVGVSGTPCNIYNIDGQPGQCRDDSSQTNCDFCWPPTNIDNPIKRIYSRMLPALQVSTWPTILKGFGSTWKVNENWTYITNPVSSGAWGCSSTFMSIVQLLVTCQAKWRKVSMCLDNGEGPSNVCTCRLQSSQCDSNCYATQLAALRQTNFSDAKSVADWKCPS